MPAITHGNGLSDASDKQPDSIELLGQASLLKTDTLQKAIFNSVHFSLIATDEKGVIQIFNVGAERMLGYFSRDVLNRITPADISDGDELVARAATLSAEFRTPIAVGFESLVFKASRGIEDIYELTYIRHDGSRFPGIVSVTALRDEKDHLIGYLLIGSDNTARKLVEQALKEKNLELKAITADLQRFRTAMDATSDAITLVDRSTMLFIEANATTCKLLGYSREELLGLGPFDIGAGGRDEIAHEYDAIISSKQIVATKQTFLVCKDGSHIDVEVQRQAQKTDNGWIIVCVIRDISERRLAEESMYRLAHYDVLTRLPNRTLFYETLERTLKQAEKSGWLVAVLFIDLDHFKNVNDSLGHPVGDELLRQFSNRLMMCVRVRDTVGRLGGDEFALILTMQDGIQPAAQVALKIQYSLHAPFTLKGHEVTITASIGITIYPDDATDPQILLQYADTAMYHAKQGGRDTFRFFTTQMNLDAMARLEMQKALRHAIENDEFLLYYQPKVDLCSGQIDGFEALLRWNRPGHGLIAPIEFIPALEETGLIIRVGSWVIEEVCRQIGIWARCRIGAVRVAVNVSGRQFIEGDLCGVVSQAIESNDIQAEMLEIELTESSLMENTERTIKTLESLKSIGVQISIDDFGTGYSSLAYLRRFPINKLKIDRSFIFDLITNAEDASIVRAIISMAHSLHLKVIAEGVESESQLAYLKSLHCDQIQGYYFSRPVDVFNAEQMIKDGKQLPKTFTQS